MPDQTFVHDASKFESAKSPSGIKLDDAEAKYAELFSEVIWDGIITADERAQLATAAGVFGLSEERVQKVEQALTAAYEARHQIRIVDDSLERAAVARPEQQVVAPLATAADPRLQALQRRIAVVERRNEELRKQLADTREAKGKLEELVARLQRSVESLTGELRAAKVAKPAEAPAASKAPAPPVALPKPAGAAPPEIPAAAKSTPGLGDRGRRIVDDSALPTSSLTQEDRPSAPGARGPSRGDPAELHRLVRRNPRDAELLRALYATLQRGEDLDRRWCIAHVLCWLGEATDEERAVHAAHASAELVKPTRAVNRDEWDELLTHPDEDRLTDDILSDIAPAVLIGQLSALRREGVSEAPFRSEDADPATSTIQAVRSLAWAAASLGLRVPPISVAPEAPGLIDLVLTPKPASRIGKLALEPRSPRELAFLAGRHLSWYRGERILAKLAGSTRHLEDVFLAALMIGNPGLPMTEDIKQRVEPIARTIAPLLDAHGVEKMRGYFARFVEQGGRTNLAKWRRCADRTTACAGMLLANDLASAEATLRLEDPAQAEDRMSELIVFFTASRCSMLRKRIGIAVKVG